MSTGVPPWRGGPLWGRSLRGGSISNRPALAAAAGAMCIASSATLVLLADAAPATVAVFRCAYALPVLGALMLREDRRFGRRSHRDRLFAAGAGVFFGIDLIFWHLAIDAAGAGIATVLGNLQVVVVGIAAWLLLGEHPSRRLVLAVPVVLSGVVLISGVVGKGAYGEDPALGVLFGVATSFAYAGFLLVLRRGGRDLRRVAGPLFDATAVAVVVSAVLAPLSGGLDLVPSWPSHGWLLLLALTSQVVGWLLISVSLPRLPAALTSMILLLQPVMSLAIAAVVLDERPSPVQLLGCAIVLAGIGIATTGGRSGHVAEADGAAADATLTPHGGRR